MNNKLLMDKTLLSISPAGRGPLVKMLITVVPQISLCKWITFCLLFNIAKHWYANVDEASLSINLRSLMNTLEPHSTF